MYLTFILPIYKQFEVFAIFPKPIIINNSSYLLKIEPKFLARNQSISMIYSENDWYNRCHLFNDQQYCLKSESEDNCNKYIIQNNFSDIDLQCFSNAINDNIAIQINSTIHFSILFPTQIKIICSDSIFLVYIEKSSKLELGNCSIKTSFLEYDDHFGLIPYKFFRQMKNEKKYENVKTRGIIYFIIIYSVFMTLIMTFTCIHTKRNNREDISFYVSTQNIDYNGNIITTV